MANALREIRTHYGSLHDSHVATPHKFQDKIVCIRKLAAQVLIYIVNSKDKFTNTEPFYKEEATQKARMYNITHPKHEFKVHESDVSIRGSFNAVEREIQEIEVDSRTTTWCEHLLNTINNREDIIYLPENELTNPPQDLVCERRVIDLKPNFYRESYGLEKCAEKVEAYFLDQDPKGDLTKQKMLVVSQTAYSSLQEVVQYLSARKTKSWWTRCLKRLPTCTLL